MIEDQKTGCFAEVARLALPRWGIDPSAALKLLSHSENAMYLVVQGSNRWVLRVHRPGYHSQAAVRSELGWMKALQQEASIETPQALPGLDGEMVQLVRAPQLPDDRMVVLFDFIPGSQPQPDNLNGAFGQLGSIAARMHQHARAWCRPAGFERPIWDYDRALGTHPNWGHWRAGFAAHKGGLEVVERADALMRSRLEAFGKGPKRFGLIHSDLRLANLMVADGQTKVIDFDDCGFGWFLYDLASSMTFLETDPNADEVIASWLAGYRQVEELQRDDLAELRTMMMFRRLIIMGWAGSHPDTDLAREMGDAYTVGTVEFAEKYLSAPAYR